ncbi:MAG: hypothetical protein H6619_02650 [Deltaproteobacteria bacterium]|nr:hypothetical protein [Deltaproteobacteria bacterium]
MYKAIIYSFVIFAVCFSSASFAQNPPALKKKLKNLRKCLDELAVDYYLCSTDEYLIEMNFSLEECLQESHQYYKQCLSE